MGKPKKLKSSIKALQEVLISIRPAVGAPLCMQPARTHSFRDVLTSFNSIYYVPPRAASPSASSDPCCYHSHLKYPRNIPSEGEINSAEKANEGEEEAISTSAAATSTSTCSSCLSSASYAVADASPDHILAEEAFPNVILSSERFFFSPFTSKSIMGESFHEVDHKEMEVEEPSSLHLFPESEETEAGDADEVGEHTFDLSVDTEAEEATVKRSSADLCKESIPMVMTSSDPYRDFRTSMEEMVMAHGLQDWSALQELLHCYLRLNEKKTHRFIVLAFMDLLAHRSSPSDYNSLSSPTPFSPAPLPTPHLHQYQSE